MVRRVVRTESGSGEEVRSKFSGSGLLVEGDRGGTRKPQPRPKIPGGAAAGPDWAGCSSGRVSGTPGPGGPQSG